MKKIIAVISFMLVLLFTYACDNVVGGIIGSKHEGADIDQMSTGYIVLLYSFNSH